MVNKTRTATISSGISGTAAKLSTLFTTAGALAAQFNDFEDVTIVNTGDVDLNVASMEGGVAAATGDFKSIPTGGELRVRRLSSKDFWVKATGGTPSLEFIGTPE